MASTAADALLPPAVMRNLSDRSFDKRKAGATEVEKIMRKLKEAGNPSAVRRLLLVLAQDFACSVNSNQRKGGLIGLASCALALTTSTADHLDLIVPAVLKSFGDQEPRVRYYACEALFNVAKICRGAILRYLNDIFIGVCRLIADGDMDVKNGAAMFDRLLKEIVMEADAVDLDRLVPLIRSHMPVANAYVRQLLVNWITSLDTVPSVSMLEHIPALLSGLFDMLADGNREIRQLAYSCLAGFLDQIARDLAANPLPEEEGGSEAGEGSGADAAAVTSSSSASSPSPSPSPSPPVDRCRVDFRPMVDIVISQITRDKDKFSRVTAVEWITQFILLGRRRLAPYYDKLVGAVLKCLSDPEPDIVAEVGRTNTELQALVRATPVSKFAAVIPGVIKTVTQEIRSRDRTTRSAALRWTSLLMAICPETVMAPERVGDVLQALLGGLTDTDDAEVLKLDLEVISRLAVYDVTFLRTRVLGDLVKLFGENRAFLETKGSFIIRRLCLLLDARTIYISLARILLASPNAEFVSLVVELLNLILLTAVELTDLRQTLRGCAVGPAVACGSTSSSLTAPATVAAASDGAVIPCAIATVDGEPTDPLAVFLALYRTWTVNPVATLALCLLAQAYDLGARIVTRFAETTISVGFLMQIDKLVQLLESPVFLSTRLHLTHPERPDHAPLLRCLYGVLMVLPQGTAFNTLNTRLQSVTSLHLSLAAAPSGGLPAVAAPAAPVTAAAGAASPAPRYARSSWVVSTSSPLPKDTEAAAASATSASPSSGTGALADLDAAFNWFVSFHSRAADTLASNVRARSLMSTAATGPASGAPASSPPPGERARALLAEGAAKAGGESGAETGPSAGVGLGEAGGLTSLSATRKRSGSGDSLGEALGGGEVA